MVYTEETHIDMITLPKSINNPEEDKLIDMLFTNYANRVYNIALKYIDDKHMAEDIVSEVFLKVIK